jgi:hypothetical protein
MRLFVAPRTGTGTHADPYRPDIDRDAVGGTWGAYEMPDGRFTVCAPNADVAPVGTVDLGADVEAPLPAGTFVEDSAPAGRMAVDVAGLTVGEAILTIDGNITPGDDGRVKITLAGVDLYDAPAIQGGATDTFTYSNGNLATVSSGVWAGVESDCVVASNAVSWSGFTFAISRYATAFSGDHYSQIDYTTSTNSEAAVVLRCSSSSVNCFYTFINVEGNAELLKITPGPGFTSLASTSGLASSGTLKGTSVGSVQTFYRNGTSILSTTNSDFNSNNYVGIGGYGEAGSTADNWQGGTGDGTAGSGSTGTIAVTEADDTVVAAGAQTHVGTISVTEADDTMVAAGNSDTGAITVIEVDDTMAAAGNQTHVGTVAVTEAADTVAAVGGVTIAGAITWTEDGDVLLAIQTSFSYPVSISARKILDQNGGVYLIKGMSSWAMGQNCSNSEITAALEGLAAKGFNAVIAAPMGVNNPGGAGWSPYTNDAAAAFFTGTPFQSSLGSAWTSVDWLMTEATRLGFTVFFSLFVSWGTTGVLDDMVAATNAQMRTFGSSVATRYAAYRNIVWHLEGDVEFNAVDPIGQRVDYYHRGIKDVEGSTNRLIAAEPYGTLTCYEQFISQEGTSPTGYEWFHVDLNNTYRIAPGDTDPASWLRSAEVMELAWAGSDGSTSEAFWCDEPYYAHNTTFSSVDDQQIRERLYATFLEGGCGINFGDEWWWPCGAPGLFSGAPSNWLTDTLAAATTAQAGYCWTLADTYVKDAAWAPTSSFVTTGAGSGDTKAAVGTKGTAAVAYFPDNRTVAVDTTIIAGTGNVRLRWLDPVLGTYSTIAASEAQTTGRSVTLPAAHADSTRDYLLVVDSVVSTGGAFVGTTPITAAYIGTTAVTKLYIGTTQAWP